MSTYPQLLEKVSCKIGLKAENILLYTSIKISENFDTKHLQWNKTDLSKETEDFEKRYSMNFSSSSSEVYCKRDVLKIFSTGLFAYQ